MAIITIDNVEYLTDNDVINRINISTRTFYNWIKQGRIIPPNRYNHRGWRLWNKDEINEVYQIVNSTFKLEDLKYDSLMEQ